MATRKRRKWRRQPHEGREPIGDCEAANCPENAVTEIFIPDDGQHHKLCEQHALAIEFQMRRNKAAAREKRQQEAAARLGIDLRLEP